MPEFFKAAGAVQEMEWDILTIRLLLSMAAGLVIALVYALSQKRPPGQMLPMFTTLVLLTMLVAMTTVVIGDSVARAFGLVGALSIVRFRTVVDDTRDTSFVIFAVIVGMAMGSGHFMVCAIGVPMVSLIAIGLSVMGNAVTVSSSAARRLVVRVGTGRDPEMMFADVFRDHLKAWTLAAVDSARQGAALDVTYRIRLRNPAGVLAFLKAVQLIEGVQNVDLKENG